MMLHAQVTPVQGWDGKQWFSQGHPAKSNTDRLPPQTRQQPLPDPVQFDPISHNDFASRSIAPEVAGQLRKRSAKAAAAEPTPNMSRIAQPLLTCFYSLNNAFLEAEPLLRVRHEAVHLRQSLLTSSYSDDHSCCLLPLCRAWTRFSTFQLLLFKAR